MKFSNVAFAWAATRRKRNDSADELLEELETAVADHEEAGVVFH